MGIFIFKDMQCSLQLYLYFTNRKTHVSLLLGIVFEKEYFDLFIADFSFRLNMSHDWMSNLGRFTNISKNVVLVSFNRIGRISLY